MQRVGFKQDDTLLNAPRYTAPARSQTLFGNARLDALRRLAGWTRSVRLCVPTRSVGTRIGEIRGGARTAAFFAGDFQHRPAEIRAHDVYRAFRRPPVGQGQIGRAGANVENRRIVLGRDEPNGFPPPPPVDAQRQQPVQEIVSPGDLAEHFLHAGGGFIERHGIWLAKRIARRVLTSRFLIYNML